MLGSAVAFRRSEHMRMTAVVANAKPAMRAYLDVVATCAALSFLLLIEWPAYEYAYEESFITTPALQIPNVWRAAALPVGTGLMALFAFLRLARAGDIRTLLGAVLSVALLIAVFWLAQPWLRPLGNINLIIFFVGVAGFCVFTGVPIAFAFGLAIFGYLALTTRTPLMVLVGRMDEGMSHLILLSVPLFVFLGLLIEMTGMARAMVAFPRRGSQSCQARQGRRDRKDVRDRPARAGAAVRDPRRRGRGHCDRDRGIDHRHRLCLRGRCCGLSPVRLAPADADADRDG